MLFAIVLVVALPATAWSLPRFDLGAVPDQTAWGGSTREFLLHWGERPDVTMTVAVDPAPAGPVSLQTAGGVDWRLAYTPAAADVTAFRITVTAAAGGAQTTQSFEMQPEPVLPGEIDFFRSGPHTQAPVEKFGLQVFSRPDAVPATLNYEQQTLHAVCIVGETVVIEAGHGNGLYEGYFDGTRRDLRTVEIIAERLIIRSPVHLKQTAVRISARELVFAAAGRIKTTPEERLESAGTNAAGGLAGVNGLPAGSIDLEVSAIQTDGPGVRFDLTGGRGQPGGPGQHGANGSNIGTSWGSVRYCDSGICKTHTPAAGYVIIYWRYVFAGITAEDEGAVSTWPTSGTDAKPSGKPGEGGAGGVLRSNFPVAGVVAQPGGATPDPTRPATSPFTYYRGGSAGTPTKTEKVSFSLGFFEMTSSVIASRVTTNGEDAVMATGTTAAGAPGTTDVTTAPYAWAHPLMLQKVLQHIRDDYLGDRLSEAQNRLDDYVAELNAFRLHPSWESTDPTHQLDVAQIHAEMRLLQQQLESGLDYFGNPAGWVPMLSFEVNQTLFRNELDRAMRSLYLAYWIGNKASTEQERFNALNELRDALVEQFTQARSDYDLAVARLPLLDQQADALTSAIRTLQGALEIEELKLLNDLREPDWVLGLRIGLKLVATMCQMLPVYQPALGAVGAGLRVASNFDPDDPWSSITEAKTIGTSYKESPFKESSEAKKTEAGKVDPAQSKQKSAEYAKSLINAANGLSAGVADMSAFIKEREAPSEEMLAELERLKSRSPEYKALMEEVESLMEQNVEFATLAVTTMQQIGTLSEFMTHCLLAIDALGRDIAPAASVLDERATGYLDALERRAYDRLVKYHYYLAKAYEYRMLRPYTEALDLEGLIQKFQEIADLNSDHIISPAQFDTLKAVYEDRLSVVAETIFDHYNANRPDLSVPVRFNLLPSEIDALNEGRPITLNLRDDGFFQASEENVRIVDLKVFAMEVEPEGALGRTAFVDLKIEHAGQSRLKKDGKIHLFRHYNRDTENPFVWGGRYDVIDNRLDPISPSEASNSLLRSLLAGDAVSDMLLYSRPSAWADLEITRTFVNSGGGKLRLKSVRLEMVYDFSPRGAGSRLRDLEVVVQTQTPGPGGQLVVEEASLMPYIQVGRSDANGRGDARGEFFRVFETSPTPILITAPADYGTWEFDRWTDRFGADLPGGPFTDPLLPLTFTDDQVIVARYREATPPPATPLVLNSPTLTQDTIALEWTGGPGIRLQWRELLDAGNWTDVPGSEGLSRFDLPRTRPSGFYRLDR